MEWYVKVIQNYAGFQGRARRTEYWMFALFNTLISLVFYGIDYLIGINVLASLYALALLVPSLAVCTRRLHDIGKSGWWILISLVPLVGQIILLIFLCKDSVEDNQYGPNPKHSERFGA